MKALTRRTESVAVKSTSLRLGHTRRRQFPSNFLTRALTAAGVPPCRLHCYCCCCCWRRLLQRQLSSASSTLHRPYSALLNITDPTHVRPTDLTFYSLSRRRLVNGLQHASSLGYFFDKYYIKLHFKVNSRKQLPNKTSTDY